MRDWYSICVCVDITEHLCKCAIYFKFVWSLVSKISQQGKVSGPFSEVPGPFSLSVRLVIPRVSQN